MIDGLLPYVIVLPSLAYALISLWCGCAFFRRTRPETGFTPPVTIFKPVKGIDADSFENFASFCCQDYPRYQILFAVASSADPVVPVIERLRREFPGRDIELVVDGSIHGPNYKVCNLVNAYPRARYDLLIVCDSDVRVRKEYLREVCAPFADPEVGLVTSLYRTSCVDSVATATEAVGFTTEMVPNVLVALRLEGLSFALGASMAVRRAALEKIGGFQVLVDYLADDYQLGNRIHNAGYRIELSDYFVESVVHGAKPRAILSRQLRWARTMRASRPGGYLASGITQSFPAACAALAVSGCSGYGIGATLLLYAVRSLTAVIYSQSFVKDGILPRWLWLLPFRDALSFITWGLAFLGNRVRWRGHLFRILPGGRIAEI